MNNRKKILVEPRFQIQLMLRLAGWVTLATVITAAIVVAFLVFADQRSAGEFFFIVQQAGSHPLLLSRSQIILPALLISLVVNLILSLTFALYYSQRLAGPIHRLTQEMLRLAQGEKINVPFQLRESDELQGVAHAFDALLASLERKASDKS